MKIKLNLATAFTLRKRIKENAFKLQRELLVVKYIDEPESVQDQLDFLTCGDVQKQIETWDKNLKAIQDLSTLIDEHNKGKELLNELNRINTEISVVTSMASNLSAKQTQKTRNPITGVWEVNKLVPITTFDTEAYKTELKQKKVRAEDELTKINASTWFEFDLDDTIYNTIYGE